MKFIITFILVVIGLCSLVHAELRCHNFDSLVAGTVYNNITGFVPGRYMSLAPIRFDGQKFFGDPKGRYYGSAAIVAATNVSTFFTSPSVAGNVLDIRQMNIEFDFRNLARPDQPKYIRFEFYDYGILQNLRVNNGTVYKGSLVSMEPKVTSNTLWYSKRARRFTSNLGEIFVTNNATRLERFWVGGDRLYIDNVCYDTDWHQPPKYVTSDNIRLSASIIPTITMAMLLSFCFLLL